MMQALIHNIERQAASYSTYGRCFPFSCPNSGRLS